MDAANIFRKANRASEVHHDNDVHELNFEEFASMMQDCALYANSSVQGLLLSRPDLCGLIDPADPQMEESKYEEVCVKTPEYIRPVLKSRESMRFLHAHVEKPPPSEDAVSSRSGGESGSRQKASSPAPALSREEEDGQERWDEAVMMVPVMLPEVAGMIVPALHDAIVQYKLPSKSRILGKKKPDRNEGRTPLVAIIEARRLHVRREGEGGSKSAGTQADSRNLSSHHHNPQEHKGKPPKGFHSPRLEAERGDRIHHKFEAERGDRIHHKFEAEEQKWMGSFASLFGILLQVCTP